jgi:hypothetical protein
LEFHGRALFATKDDDGSAFYADCAGTTFDGLLGIFYLKDVAIRTEN